MSATSIAPADWEAALAPFVALRAASLDVKVVALEDVLARVEGVDAPERVKRYLNFQGMKFMLFGDPSLPLP